MGNCGTARDYDDVTGDFQDIEQEYKSANLKSQRKLKQNAESDDPLYSTLISIVPNEYLSTNREHFKRLYRVKKNIKCEDNDFYQIKVIENKRTAQLFNAKIITKEIIKLMKEENFKALFISEIKSLTIINHPNCERLVKVFLLKKESSFKLIMITNYCPKKSLLDVINEHIKRNEKFTKKEIVTVAKILSIVAYKFKASNIVFRNFSPDNIFFLKEGHFLTLNIRNFYFSTIVGKSRIVNGMYGGLWYLSPEQLKDLKYDFKSDIWNIGIILYMMITFENPFSKCSSREEVFEKLKKKELFKSDEELSSLCVDYDIIKFVKRCLYEKQNLRADSEILVEDDLIRFNETESNLTNDDIYNFINYDEAFVKTLAFKLENKLGIIIHGIVFYIVMNFNKFFIDDNDLIKMNELFLLFDKNNNSVITFDEMAEMLTERLCQHDDKETNKIHNRKIESYIYLLHLILFQNKFVNEYHGIKNKQISYDLFFIGNILLKLVKLKNTKYLDKVKNIIFDELDINDNKKLEGREFMNFFKKKSNSIFREFPLLEEKIMEQNGYSIEKNGINAQRLGEIISYDIIRLTSKQNDEIINLSVKKNKY
jgi:serine/threonine protein kinase